MAPLENTIPSGVDTSRNEDDIAQLTPLQAFYKNKSVFLTGGTGFLGKVTTEMLLRKCDVKTCYLLVRSKKGKDVHARLESIFDDPLFDRLKQEKPKFRHRIVAITGDCVLPGLGICAAERAILQKEVHIVFHVAATVRFDEKLKLALGINVCGTREILQLAREMTDLKAFVHVSTAYSNCNRSEVNEKFYKGRVEGEDSLKLSDCLDEKMMDNITPQLLQDWPNSYTFTKALAEDLVRTSSKGLPVVIFRPAIVIPTYQEPVVGWIDNVYGPTGIIVGVGTGLLRVIRCKKEQNANIVPVDMCCNSMLACAWEVSNNSYEEPPIYNFVTSDKNPINWEQYTEYGRLYGEKIPPLKSLWYPSFKMTSSKIVVELLKILYHLLPALLIDIALFVTGKKPKMLSIYKKIHKFCDVLAYFGNQKWHFTNTNVQLLWKKLDVRDQELFFFDVDKIDWPKFVAESFLGIRTYLLKEDPKNIPIAMKRYKRQKFIHFTVTYAVKALGLYLIYLSLAYLITALLGF